jgi:AAA+ ATPase superfamily predicted ATPase
VRSVHYDLSDPLLRFWFRFIFPSTSYIRHMGADRALKDLIRPHLDSWFGQCFERLCREALPWLYLKEGVTAAFEVGQYWSKTTQIDVASLRDDGWTDLGECKWGTVRSPKAVEQELEKKVQEFPDPRGATIGRRIFTMQAPKAAGAAAGARWHGLEDLYT